MAVSKINLITNTFLESGYQLNLVLAMIDCDMHRCNKVVFVKYRTDFKVFFSKIIHTISNIIFHVMSYMDGDFNNSRK